MPDRAFIRQISGYIRPPARVLFTGLGFPRLEIRLFTHSAQVILQVWFSCLGKSLGKSLRLDLALDTNVSEVDVTQRPSLAA
jgi:hypothetical protein